MGAALQIGSPGKVYAASLDSQLMAVIFLAAVGLLALRNANPLWAALAFLSAFVSVWVEHHADGASEDRRPWYAGYSIASGTYLLMAFHRSRSWVCRRAYLLNGAYHGLWAPSFGNERPWFWSSYSYAKDEIQHLKAMNKVRAIGNSMP